MKKLYIVLLFLAPVMVMAQTRIDRSKAPKPGPAPKIEIADPAAFTLANGLRVFVVQNTKLPRVSATLTIDRDPIMEGDKAGLVSLAGGLMTRGTQKLSKADLDEAVDFLGGDLSGSATSVSVSALKGNFPRLMELMADVALRPAFNGEELEKLRKQAITGLQAQKDNPEAIASNVVSRLVYGASHPYGEIETEETVKRVTLDDVKKYYNTYWKPNIAYLVFVGDISPTEARTLAEKHFAGWKRGEVKKASYTQPKAPAKTYIAVVDRPASVQSVITLVAPVDLKPGSPNAIPVSVMNDILGGGMSGRLFINLREKYGFTYGAYSNISPDRLVGRFSASASVRTEKTDSAIGQFLHEFNRIRTEPVPMDEVSRMKNSLSGSFARSLEQPGTIAAFALNVSRYNLPKDYYRNYLTNLSRVTPADVQRVANSYVQPGNMHIVIVGNAKGIDGLEKYGEVKYFDMYGNEVAKPVEKAIDPAVTVESVIQRAIDAMGGIANIEKIKDITMNGTVDFMGNKLNISEQYVLPAAYSRKVTMDAGVLMSELMNGEQFTKTQRGMPVPVEEEEKEEMRQSAAFFPEIFMRNNGFKFSLTGIETVNGNDAYAVHISSPAGRSFTYYYDVKTGLRVKSLQMEEGPMGSMTIQTYFQDYDERSDVKIPVKILIDLGPIQQLIEYKDVKVNTGLKAADIK